MNEENRVRVPKTPNDPWCNGSISDFDSDGSGSSPDGSSIYALLVELAYTAGLDPVYWGFESLTGYHAEVGKMAKPSHSN